MRTYALTIDEPAAPLLNVNSLRGQTRWFAKGIKQWRHAGFVLARESGLPRPLAMPVRIWIEVRYPDNHMRDITNLFPTAKALVDGLVDSGVLTADHDGAVEGPWLRRVYPNGPRRVRIVLQEIERFGLGREFDIATM